MTTRYVDPWFRDGRHASAAPVVEPARYLDPSFRTTIPNSPHAVNLLLAPEPAAPPFLAWLFNHNDDPAFVGRVTAAYRQGRILLGIAATDRRDRQGEVLKIAGMPAETDVLLRVGHYHLDLGTARVWKRTHAALLCGVLSDTYGGRQVARAVAEGKLTHLSMGAIGFTRTGTVVTKWTPAEVSLCDEASSSFAPANPDCRVMQVNNPGFDEFARVVLGLKGVLPWL